MSGPGAQNRMAAARRRARLSGKAQARRKARLARVNARPAMMRTGNGHLRDAAAKSTIAQLEPVQPLLGTTTPMARDPYTSPERTPRIALGLGAAVIAAVALLLPATRPQWLALMFAPQTRVADVVPGAPLTPRAPAGETQALALPQASAGEGLDSVAVAPPVPQAAPGEGLQPASAQGPNTAIPNPAAIDPAEARPARAASAMPQATVRSVTVTGAISALAAYDAGDSARAERMARCEADFSVAGRSAAGPVAPVPPESFGKALAEAALQQTQGFGVYTDSYRKIAFPLGDVPALFGVCTDVVIRAYRALGIDLQARVHAARVGALDASIAHRRTYTLRRYFASRGASLPISDFAEDYLPGDIVTYYRPQNSGSKDHIAIVADKTGPSGRPMIIHNRGWGVQIEDALFVDQITGHYRYSGAETPLSKIKSARLKRQPVLEKPSPAKNGK